MEAISRRAYQSAVSAYSWAEIFEAGPYYERVSKLLEDAQDYAIFVGWQIDSRLPFPVEPLKEKVLRLVESKPDFHFYFLMWDHAYFYVLEREAWQGRIWDDLHPRVHFLFDNRHPFGGSHHEKVCIIDGKTAFCGGIDLCDERWDSPQHLYNDPRRSLNRKNEHHGPYHDVAVEVTGPVCGEIQRHVQSRWIALSKIPFPKPPLHLVRAPESLPLVYVSRTAVQTEESGTRYVVREIEFLFRDLIHLAEKRIILEGQYYWSDEINDMLIAKIGEMRGRDFEIVLILADPLKLRALTHQLSFYEFRLLEKLETAARIAGVRLKIGSPHVHAPHSTQENISKPIYIHSKIIIIDDRFLSIGSANLATRALRVDTEINLTFEARTDAERNHIRKFAQSVLNHWNHSGVYLHSLNPERASHPRFLQRMIPWKFFFDPKLPWFFPLERNFRRLSKHRFPWVIIATVLLWGISTLASWGLSQTFIFTSVASGVWIYAAILSSVWFAPVPFSWIAALSIFHLGFDRGVVISVCSLWIAALQGYWVTRGFPSYLTRFYRASGPSWLPKRLGLRQFPDVISVSLDPRVTLRSKIAYQGLYCVPFPWFVMSLLTVLPSALYVLLLLLHKLVPEGAALKIQSIAPRILILFAGYAIIRLFGSSFRKYARHGNTKT